MTRLCQLRQEEIIKAIEQEMQVRGKSIDEASLGEMDKIWEQIKSKGKI